MRWPRRSSRPSPGRPPARPGCRRSSGCQRLLGDERGGHGHPDRQPDPVPPQREPDQRPGPGQRAASWLAGAPGPGQRDAVLGQLVAVVAEEQLLQRRRGAAQRRGRRSRSGAAATVVEVVGVDVEADAGRPRPRRRARPAASPGRRPAAPSRPRSPCASGGAARSGCRSARVRPARMMLTRSHSASASARMWLDSSTVRPSARTSRMQSWNTASMSGSRPDVGSSRISSSASEARAATSATFCRLPFE